MNKIDSEMRVLSLGSLPVEAQIAAPATGRLVVVIPDTMDEAVLAGRIHELASHRGLGVLLLGVCSSPVEEIELRRKLAVLAAFIRQGGTQVEIRIQRGKDWIDKLGALLGNDDRLVACVDPIGSTRGPLMRDALSSQLDLPVYVFSAADASHEEKTRLLAQISAWLGSLGILAGFLWLQMQLIQTGDEAATSIWLILSVLMEIGLIWLWNSLLG